MRNQDYVVALSENGFVALEEKSTGLNIVSFVAGG
jgi:hypothetical protein